jgi:hypothetical protein
MIFKNIFSKKVNFDDGSYVEWLNREAIRYVNGKLELSINFLFDWEGSSSKSRLLNIDEIINWDEPCNMENISEEDRKEILEKIKCYCKKKGISCKFESTRNAVRRTP